MSENINTYGENGTLAGVEAYRDGYVLTGRESADFERGYWSEHDREAEAYFESTLPASECLEFGAECEGPVELRPAMSPTGKWFARCEHHFAERLESQERIVRRYGGQMFY